MILPVYTTCVYDANEMGDATENLMTENHSMYTS
jgi:hypothetical protein